MTEPQKKQAIRFTNPNYESLGVHIASCAARKLPMAQKDSASGEKGAVICGLGPSLDTEPVFEEVRSLAEQGWQVWGIKEALPYLMNRGLKVRCSANMDPGSQETKRVTVVPGVTYYLASSCHPDLFDHVLDQGGKVEVYHSACGYKDTETRPGFSFRVSPEQDVVCLGVYEMRTVNGLMFTPLSCFERDEIGVYRDLFECADVIVGGFTVANRAMGLARYLGFPRVVLAGVDFGWRSKDKDDTNYYAGFVEAEPLRDVFMTDHGQVDGSPWRTRPDLLASAVDVARLIKKGEVEVLGDSLAVALSVKDDDYLDRLVQIKQGV